MLDDSLGIISLSDSTGDQLLPIPTLTVTLLPISEHDNAPDNAHDNHTVAREELHTPIADASR